MGRRRQVQGVFQEVLQGCLRPGGRDCPGKDTLHGGARGEEPLARGRQRGWGRLGELVTEGGRRALGAGG